MRSIFETAIAAEVFRGTALLAELVAVLANEPKLHAAYEALMAAWPKKKTGARVFLGLIRWSFLIELVKTPKIETTKFEVRWAARLGKDDPRYATYDECLEICTTLATEAAKSLADADRRALMEAFVRCNMVPYELPIDYRKRETTGRLHVHTNVEWLWDGVAKKTIELREFLLDRNLGTHRATFDAAYKGKIDVKTYLTDRVLTGAHKTNREKRWETHPGSVHYALRRDCLEIEYNLIQQLCHFDGFPREIMKQLRAKDLIKNLPAPFRCPITLDPLSFQEFESEILNPVQGKSSFQVGHLNPLKAINDDPHSGHTAKNISWVSANGNRIQGSLSLTETRAMILRIAESYDKYGLT